MVEFVGEPRIVDGKIESITYENKDRHLQGRLVVKSDIFGLEQVNLYGYLPFLNGQVVKLTYRDRKVGLNETMRRLISINNGSFVFNLQNALFLIYE